MTTRKKVSLPKGIYQRPDGKYVASPTHKGHRASRVCLTLTEAILAKEELLTDLRGEQSATPRSGRPDTATWTLAEALSYAIKIPKGRGAEGGWRGSANETHAIAHAQVAIAYFGAGCPLTEIGREELDDYALMLERKGDANGTINRKLAVLSKLMTLAHTRGHLAAKPFFPRREEGEGRDYSLSSAEEEALLTLFTRWGKLDHWDATVVLLDTGARCGELWKLRGVMVDMGQNQIVLRQRKGQVTTPVPMTPRVREIMERRRLTYGLDRPFPYTHDWYRYLWDKAKGALGQADKDYWVPHILRHTCATRLVQRGVPVMVVMKWMGHKSLKTTQRYTHLMQDDLHAAMKVLVLPPTQQEGKNRA